MMQKLCALGAVTGLAVAADQPTQTLSNGVEMPMLAYGVFQYNDSQAEEGVYLALQNGFSMIDGGQQYLNNVGVGRGFNRVINEGLRKREDLFLQAKIDGCGFTNISVFDCYGDTKKMLERQLTELNVPYVDSAVLHFPPQADLIECGCNVGVCPMVQAQWKAVVEFYNAKKTRAVGVSNYCKNCYACLSPDDYSVMPQIHQIQYHLGMGPDKFGYVTHAKEHNMSIQAYSTLANKPEWFKWEPRGINPQILNGKAFDGALGKIAKAHGKTTIQTALKWVVQQGFTALTKSGSAPHLKADTELWDFELTDGEMKPLNTEIAPWPESGADHGLHGTPAWACHPPGSDPGFVV